MDFLPNVEVTTDGLLVARAFQIATFAHAEQKRDDGAPYMVHVVRTTTQMAAILSYHVRRESINPYTVEEGIATMVLHDVPEDHPEYDDEILKLNKHVHKLAHQLRNPSVDYPKEDRETRKKMDREHMDSAHAIALIAKYLDRIDNLKDSGSMREGRRRRAVKESRLLAPHLDRLGTLPFLVDLNKKLAEELHKTINDLEKTCS